VLDQVGALASPLAADKHLTYGCRVHASVAMRVPESDERKLRQRAFYYTRIYADPKDKDVVYVLNVGFWKSTDGGKTYKAIRTPHSDNHDLWIDPADPKRMIEGNDGGGNVSVNGGESWTDQDFPTAQMYHVVTTRHFPYQVCGAQQDNSTLCLPSDGTGSQWYTVGGGESGYIAPDPRDTDVFYAGSYGGFLSRFDRETNQRRNIQVWPENPMGHSASDIAERFQWTFPIVFSPHDPRVIYTGSQHLFRTTNEGQSWERISPNLRTRGRWAPRAAPSPWTRRGWRRTAPSSPWRPRGTRRGRSGWDRTMAWSA